MCCHVACECFISELKVGRRGGSRKSSKEKAKVVVFSQLSGRVVTCMVREEEGRGGEEEGRREGVIKEGIVSVCVKHEQHHNVSLYEL